MTNYPIRSRRRPGYGKALTLWLLFAGASLFATDHPAAAATTAAASVDAQAFPREFKEADLRFWLHPPQFETFAGNHVTGRAAVSVQIGERLHIAASTVEVHRRNLMRKLDLHNVAELTRYAITEGISPASRPLDGRPAG